MILLDTNVLVYAHDARDETKRAAARSAAMAVKPVPCSKAIARRSRLRDRFRIRFTLGVCR